MNKAKGFTLIELVVVIVILGILSVTAAPKFLNLTSDARAATLKGAEGAIRSADAIVYGKAALEGKETQDSAEIKLKGRSETLTVRFGHVGLGADNLKAVADLNGFIVEETSFPEHMLIVTQDKSLDIGDPTWFLYNECRLEIRQNLNRTDDPKDDTGELMFKQIVGGC